MRIKLAIILINLAIRVMPKEWQTQTAIINLIKTRAIKTKDGDL